MAKGNKSAKSPQERKAESAAQKITRFKKLANVRVNRALKSLTSVAALGNRRSYTYTDDEAKRIVDAIRAKADAIQAAFDTRPEDAFTL